MSNTVHWANPYASRNGSWRRGNLHTHTCPASPCGIVSVERMLELYIQAGYDFLAFSDHMGLTTAPNPRITLLHGMEWNDKQGESHAGIYAGDPFTIAFYCEDNALPALLYTLASSEALVVLNHPNCDLSPCYRQDEMLALPAFDGVEILNTGQPHGEPLAVDKWDYLLTNGRRVLGFAGDDAHIESDIGKAWIFVRAADNLAVELLSAIKAGNFYASSGAIITDIRRDGARIELETENGLEIQVSGHGGQLLHRVRDHSLSYDTSALDSAYVRFTVCGEGSAMAWTQPFFLR